MTNYEFYKDELEEAVRNIHNMYVFLNIHHEEIGILEQSIDEPKIPDIQMMRFMVWLFQEYKEPENPKVDWNDVPVDAPCLVMGASGKKWHNRYFARVEGGVPKFWLNGKTSWTADQDEVSSWSFYKLAEE